jgi:RNA polymerase sigma-70 factor (ECF subfamily)
MGTSGLSRSTVAADAIFADDCPVARPSFDETYRTFFPFVFRNAGRLGVHRASIDDVVQEVFLVVHRRLPDYDGRAPMKSWVYGILAHVVRTHRRTLRRRDVASSDVEAADLVAEAYAEPHRLAEQREAARLLFSLLDRLDDDKREVLILSELEQMTVPEIAHAIGANLNTVYSRVKAAKKAFIEIHSRESARAAWGRR